MLTTQITSREDGTIKSPMAHIPLAALAMLAVVLSPFGAVADAQQNQPDQTSSQDKSTGSVKMPQTGDSLSQKLSNSGGTIKPPPTHDTNMVEPPPKTRDPMIVKPGTTEQTTPGTEPPTSK